MFFVCFLFVVLFVCFVFFGEDFGWFLFLGFFGGVFGRRGAICFVIFYILFGGWGGGGGGGLFLTSSCYSHRIIVSSYLLTPCFRSFAIAIVPVFVPCCILLDEQNCDLMY